MHTEYRDGPSVDIVIGGTPDRSPRAAHPSAASAARATRGAAPAPHAAEPQPSPRGGALALPRVEATITPAPSSARRRRADRRHRTALRARSPSFVSASGSELLADDEVDALIAAVPYFRDALPVERIALREQCEQLLVGRYARVIREGVPGEQASCFFVLARGVVEVWNQRGFRIRLGAGRWFGESALVVSSKFPRSHSVSAASDALLLRFDQRRLARHPQTSVLLRRQAAAIENRIKSNLLQSLPFFSGLAPRVVAEIAPHFRYRDAIGGTALCTEGDTDARTAREMFFIQHGTVGVYVGGRQVSVVRHTDEQPWVGERSLFMHAPRAASVLCIEPTRVLALHANALRPLVEAVPSILQLFRRQDRFYAAQTLRVFAEADAAPRAAKGGAAHAAHGTPTSPQRHARADKWEPLKRSSPAALRRMARQATAEPVGGAPHAEADAWAAGSQARQGDDDWRRALERNYFARRAAFADAKAERERTRRVEQERIEVLDAKRRLRTAVGTSRRAGSPLGGSTPRALGGGRLTTAVSTPGLAMPSRGGGTVMAAIGRGGGVAIR